MMSFAFETAVGSTGPASVVGVSGVPGVPGRHGWVVVGVGSGAAGSVFIRTHGPTRGPFAAPERAGRPNSPATGVQGRPGSLPNSAGMPPNRSQPNCVARNAVGYPTGPSFGYPTGL